MNPSAAERARLAFLFRVVGREAAHLRSSDGRVFARPMTPERVAGLAADIDDSERIEAFVARFARLQDTLGDKLLPAVLLALGEPVGAAIDNLDRGERLGLLPSADQWIAARRLRNRMVHEPEPQPAARPGRRMRKQAPPPATGTKRRLPWLASHSWRAM